jgi:formylglycine-generating enzyme required for sulfatase activity
VLFPVMILEQVKIPLEFRDVQAAHLMDWQPEQDHAGFDQFLDDLARVIGVPMTAVIQPSPVPPSPTHESLSLPKTAAYVESDRAALRGNNNLSALNVVPGALEPTFAVNTIGYTVTVGAEVTSVAVTPRTQDTAASMTVNGQVTNSGDARTIALSGPGSKTFINIVVTAPNGVQKTYVVNVCRAALGKNNNLQSLSVSPGALSPSFSASQTVYTVNVGDNVTSATVTPTLQDDNSSLTINGQGTSSGQARSITLAPAGSSTEIEIIVTAPNGSSKTYLITASRAALPPAAEVEPERQEPEPSAAPAGVVNSASQREPLGQEEATGVGRESAQAGEDRSSESAGTGRSTGSFSYLRIGLGALVALGALAYFAGGPFFVKKNEPLSRPTEELPSTKTDVATPTAVPEPVKQPSVAATQEKLTVKEGVGPPKEAPSKESKRNQVQPKARTPSPDQSKKPLVRATEGTSPTDEELIRVHTPADEPRLMASPAKTITGKDGAPMVLVPAGDFIMGSRADDKVAGSDERPAHRVYLDAYYIDQYEVTTARYAKFFQETKRREPEFWSEQVLKQHTNKPVVGVDWNDAVAYCSWAGKRLPTEAEWEKAARGTDQRMYPWGDQAPTDQRANFNHCCDFKDYGALTEVGSFEGGKSPYGAYDMAGNVWEWVADWYDGDYYGKSPEQNPKGPSGGKYRVIRGGSWLVEPVVVRSADRHGWLAPTGRLGGVGFRCAQDVPQ